ncbi:hypothetical protein LBW59_01750 [Ralstonia solanacearum]|uniref:Uncharacterized protein n=1 Tax=Ralstonia solanacearum TaxID=305 RepID=A0AAW5ZIU5_RALSL|nr:hypothetical protein [Ralstonia solanacearum]MDB0569498.1 hypothetical protein [Ralstonia solanacearum]
MSPTDNLNPWVTYGSTGSGTLLGLAIDIASGGSLTGGRRTAGHGPGRGRAARRRGVGDGRRPCRQQHGGSRRFHLDFEQHAQHPRRPELLLRRTEVDLDRIPIVFTAGVLTRPVRPVARCRAPHDQHMLLATKYQTACCLKKLDSRCTGQN